MEAVPVTQWLAIRPAVPVWAAVPLAAALVAATVWALRRWPAPVARQRRVVLRVLRAAAVACAVLVLLRPVIAWQGRREVRGEVAILLDASRSGAIRDEIGPGGRPVARVEAVRGAFADAGPAWGRLASRRPIRVFAFGSRLRAVDTVAPPPEDPRTDPGQALAELRRMVRRPAAVVLVGDGRANRRLAGPPDEVARELAAAGAPVHTVGVGSPEPTDRVRDTFVRDLRAPGRVFAGNRAAVRAVVGALGMARRGVEVVLRVDGQEVDRRTLRPASHLETREVAFSPALDDEGLARISVSVEPVDGEPAEANNRAETRVRVERGGVRVLYLEGRLRPEGKFIARALGQATEIELDRRILVGPAAAEAAPTAEEIADYDVVLLGDLRADSLPAEALSRLADRVQSEGTGLGALAGLDAFGPGGWADTPLADLLPMTIQPEDGQVPGPVAFRPTAAGGRHFVLNVAPSVSSAAVFEKLPPHPGASVLGPVHPAGLVLAASEAGKPLLAVRDLGRSRSAVLAVETTWLWVLAPEDPAGPEHHARFWRHLVLWLAGREDGPKGDLWVAADRARYVAPGPDRPVHVEVRAGVGGKDASRLAVGLTGPDGAKRDVVLSEAGPGLWRRVLRLSEPGSYTLRAEARVDGGDRTAETTFELEVRDPELADVLADHDALRQIARVGGGTFRTLDDLPALLDDLASAAASEPESEPVMQRAEVTSTPLFVAAFLALLACEWVLRRHWGLA